MGGTVEGCCELFGHCITKVRDVSAFSAQSKTCFRGRWTLPHSDLVLITQGIAGVREVSGLGNRPLLSSIVDCYLPPA